MVDAASWLRRAAGPRQLTVLPAGREHRCGSGAHSRVADGRRLCWRPDAPDGVRYAVDAEIAGQPVPAALGRRLTPGVAGAAWTRWTRAEVCAKLLDVPILVWVTQHGWPDAAAVAHGARTVQLLTDEVDGLVVSFGVLSATRGTGEDRA